MSWGSSDLNRGAAERNRTLAEISTHFLTAHGAELLFGYYPIGESTRYKSEKARHLQKWRAHYGIWIVLFRTSTASLEFE